MHWIVPPLLLSNKFSLDEQIREFGILRARTKIFF